MKTIIANWKMNVGVRESVALARGTLLTLRGRKLIPEMVICPPFTALTEVRKVTGRSALALGAQNLFWEASGSYTGEISSRMLQELNVSFVVIGHSERRQYLGETDEMVNKKVLHAVHERLTPVICVGENKEAHDTGQARDVIAQQLTKALQGVRLPPSGRIFVAYEPVWAIGTGVSADVQEVVEMHQFILSVLQSCVPDATQDQFRVIYGGSVDGENAYAFLREPEISGVLVGGASIKLNQFNEIVSCAVRVLEAQSSV